MKVYTLQIGMGEGGEIHTAEHSETIYATDLPEAIERAREITKARDVRSDSNIVRLLEELGEDTRLMWFRSIEVIKNA